MRSHACIRYYGYVIRIWDHNVGHCLGTHLQYLSFPSHQAPPLLSGSRAARSGEAAVSAAPPVLAALDDANARREGHVAGSELVCPGGQRVAQVVVEERMHLPSVLTAMHSGVKQAPALHIKF